MYVDVCLVSLFSNVYNFWFLEVMLVSAISIEYINKLWIELNNAIYSAITRIDYCVFSQDTCLFYVTCQTCGLVFD